MPHLYNALYLFRALELFLLHRLLFRYRILLQLFSSVLNLYLQKEEKINSLEIKEEHKDFFKNLFGQEPTPKGSDLLVELVGQNPFLKIKSVKNVDTGEDMTERFVSRDADDVNSLWLFTKHLEWVPQNV